MTGPEHYTKGDEIMAYLSEPQDLEVEPLTDAQIANIVAHAQTHYLAAQVAATAEARGLHWEAVLK
jgi:hypothetical protein